MSNPQGDDKPASVETCPDCGRPKGRGAVDECGVDDPGTTFCRWDCARITVAKLRAEVETLKKKAYDQSWSLGSEIEEGHHVIAALTAEVETLRARVGKPSVVDIVRNGGNQEWLLRLIESTRKGECYNCQGDGHTMWLDGPRVCIHCGGTGRFPAPPSAPEAPATKEGE